MRFREASCRCLGSDLLLARFEASVRRSPTEPRRPPFLQPPSAATARRSRSRRPFAAAAPPCSLARCYRSPSLDSVVLEVHVDIFFQKKTLLLVSTVRHNSEPQIKIYLCGIECGLLGFALFGGFQATDRYYFLLSFCLPR